MIFQTDLDEGESPSQKELMDELDENNRTIVNNAIGNYETFVNSDDTEYVFEGLNNYHRKIMYKVLDDMTPNFNRETYKSDKNWRDKHIKVTKMSKEDKDKITQSNNEKKQRDFDQVFGFTKVWKMLQGYKNPVVGHNCLFDILFTFEHYNKKLPFNFNSFKEIVNK